MDINGVDALTVYNSRPLGNTPVYWCLLVSIDMSAVTKTKNKRWCIGMATVWAQK